jgi:predicted O-methyltransferase YrrM
METFAMFAKLKRFIRDDEALALATLPKAPVEAHNLRTVELSFNDWLEWPAVSKKINEIQPVEDMKTGGVNPGDRRAIYHLIRLLQPKRVLEIGTHVGASTMHIAAALKENGEGQLATVDIQNVNSPDGYWHRFGLRCSPADAMSALGLADRVKFYRMPSVEALKSLGSFDFVFLDGDHSALTVYQELPLALSKLRNGVILLHDYFPNNKPLWNNGSVIRGPFIACARFLKEGAQFKVTPLGKLPWPTKLGSNITSLALVHR